MLSISNSILYVSGLCRAIAFPINYILNSLLLAMILLHLCLSQSFRMLVFGIGGGISYRYYLFNF